MRIHRGARSVFDLHLYGQMGTLTGPRSGRSAGFAFAGFTRSSRFRARFANAWAAVGSLTCGLEIVSNLFLKKGSRLTEKPKWIRSHTCGE